MNKCEVISSFALFFPSTLESCRKSLRVLGMAFIRCFEPQAIAFGYAATCGVTANKTNHMAWKYFKQEYWLLIFHNHNVLYIQREQFTSYLNSLACLMPFLKKTNKKTPLDILVILLTCSGLLYLLLLIPDDGKIIPVIACRMFHM